MNEKEGLLENDFCVLSSSGHAKAEGQNLFPQVTVDLIE